MDDNHDPSMISLHDIRADRPSSETVSSISEFRATDPELHQDASHLPTQSPNVSSSKNASSTSSAPLQRAVYPVYLVLVYSAAALYAWVVTCILAHRPINGISYGIEEVYQSFPLQALFNISEHYLRAARIIQSMVSVATIPLTSAICSQAAVVYLQRRRRRNGLSLRQSMALADKGWTDINILAQLILGRWKRYSSSLLLLSVLLHLLGAILYPVQQLFLSYKTIPRIQGPPYPLAQIAAVSDLFQGTNGSLDPFLNGTYTPATALLRAKLASPDINDVQSRLWSSNNNSRYSGGDTQEPALFSPVQTQGQNAFATFNTTADLYWAELPTTTNLGFSRGFAPRINSTAIWENNTDAQLPANCSSTSGAFYFHYVHEYDGLSAYDVEGCMPGDASVSPWKAQNGRQDFTEELYLNVNTTATLQTGFLSSKLTLQTTMGYFELPNYANGGSPGPLIDVLDEATASSFFIPADSFGTPSAKGPLQSIALALFGSGSFADAQNSALAAYVLSNMTYTDCIQLMPFYTLALSFQYPDNPAFDPCVYGADFLGSYGLEERVADMHQKMTTYFQIFSGEPLFSPSANALEKAFSVAAFLTNDAMMTSTPAPALLIVYAPGVETQVPSISKEGIIIISVLLATYLLCLLAMALYSAWIPRWTTTLNSFAMLRIGASISEKVPLLATNHTARIEVLDELPGWMGSEPEGEISRLCLGGRHFLEEKGQYACYETDVVEQHSASTEQGNAVRRDGYASVVT